MFKKYLKEIKHLKHYIIINVTVIALSYSLCIFFDYKTLRKLTHEDGFIENLTVVFFVFAAVLFFIAYRRTKNMLLLGLALLVFLGAGEEVSWGQRIFHFRTPEEIDKINVQHEFNVHNLEAINYTNSEGVKKTGWRRFLEINFLFRIFCLVFFVCVPLFFYHMKFRFISKKKFQMPVPPFTIGIFFLLSWATLAILKYFIIHPDKVSRCYEIFECTTAYIYFIAALYFYNTKDGNFLGKDIKESLL
jgi:hypothetical protein